MTGYETILLSRWQFAITAMYHFLFVPLTLGLSALLGIMETVYVMTGREIWKQMTKYWGILFGINFAMGVATGITMEFQFGTNWAYFSQYVGDVFGSPVAVEGLMAFFMEATFVGLFFFGWERLPKVGHLIVTWLVAIGSSFSALWILVANAWMNHPVGAHFDFHTMRMEISNFKALLFNPVAQAKFVHTISAGYVMGAIFVLAISAFYLLRNRNVEFAKRSMTVAISFGLASALSVVVLGDESGYVANQMQKMKIAAIEGMWETEPAPASFNLFGIPIQSEHITRYRIQIPYILGLMATRSFHQVLPGINELVQQNKGRIQNGIKAYSALTTLEKNPNNIVEQRLFKKYENELGYGLLLKRFIDDPTKATPAEIDKAAWLTVPANVAILFWAFRIMVGVGFFFIILFAIGFYFSTVRRFDRKWFLYLSLLSLPLPWIAVELGWFVAEHGRQPWVVEGMLPTFLGTSTLTAGDLITSLAGFALFYTALAVVEIYLMVKYIRLGPDGVAAQYSDPNKKAESTA
ncbi:cytochrome d terminal oxidase subunit 1 [Coxiella burnetii]|uniref:cytochrome ubiquinol oxidase subunit I n=1 Tax=Coxiella burnetii TaxID=777 RepID=UPI0000DAEA38|nr:cytochrome ubiquinol oxidase subunit I [Coxiella burnetii]ABX77275.1 cytochrome d ubiquinol oxidase, subunit I [Coxiella burnetii RSA 331]AML49257.1 cytochrome d terminal oxidase subunit 1 [Coxiella burnetii]AML55192.1 cytochrome d terminal oxidase subunit 1 [Coxiella burnetii]ATN69172.1 cytochrome d terminal oxidase subunit 1 [Coxiella burnetii]ATN71088.1 cytochrome d terminal oxidase subunit 1 [Coxiella burnetii]